MKDLDIEAPWVGDYYEKYFDLHYQVETEACDDKEEDMSDLYKYDPDICDGDFCPQDCDRCPKADREEEEDGGEVY